MAFFAFFKAKNATKNLKESGEKMGFHKMMEILQEKNKGKIVSAQLNGVLKPSEMSSIMKIQKFQEVFFNGTRI